MKKKQCCLCGREGSSKEIKSVGTYCLDDRDATVSPLDFIARMRVESYGIEYPEKLFCRECFEKLSKIFG